MRIGTKAMVAALAFLGIFLHGAETLPARQKPLPGQTAQRPHRPDQKADDWKEQQHPDPGALVPPFHRAGDDPEHTPGHEKRRNDQFHTGSSPLCRITLPEQTSAAVSQHAASVRSHRASALR